MPDVIRRINPPLKSSWWEIISASAGLFLSVDSIRRETLIKALLANDILLTIAACTTVLDNDACSLVIHLLSSENFLRAFI